MADSQAGTSGGSRPAGGSGQGELRPSIGVDLGSGRIPAGTVAPERRGPITRSRSATASEGVQPEDRSGEQLTNPNFRDAAWAHARVGEDELRAAAEEAELRAMAEAAMAAAQRANEALEALRARRRAMAGASTQTVPVPELSRIAPAGTISMVSNQTGQEAAVRAALQGLWLGERASTSNGPQQAPRVQVSSQAAGLAYQAQAPRPEIGSMGGGVPPVSMAQVFPQVVKVQPAPRFSGTTYISYKTWAGQFKFCAMMQGLRAHFCNPPSFPVADGLSQEHQVRHTQRMQEYSATIIRAYGELL
ncbi:hypothetical protein EBZ38_14905, partial [bacterium]|nr:hypothetical protein [bacterium]